MKIKLTSASCADNCLANSFPVSCGIATFRLRVDAQAAAVRVNQSKDGRQPEAAVTRLGAEKRLGEKGLPRFVAQARARVRDGDFHALSRRQAAVEVQAIFRADITE